MNLTTEQKQKGRIGIRNSMIVWFFIMAFIYAATAFLCLETNPLEWSLFARLMFILISAVMTIVCLVELGEALTKIKNEIAE